jgi:2-polyprenyl-3-methyl-5-hydroxy-6-metoxy-1,4-benzoquinol methylase
MAEELARVGWRVIAVDEDPALLDALRQRSGIPTCRAEATALPVEDRSLDGVIAMEIMEHLDDPVTFGREIARVLRPGGAALVSVPTSYTERVYRRLHPRYWSTTTHRQVFTRRRLTTVLTEAGLDVRSLHSVGFDAAARWLVHATIRTDFDFTGQILGHRKLDGAMTRSFDVVSRWWLGRKALGALGRIAGKSYHAYCVRADG